MQSSCLKLEEEHRKVEGTVCREFAKRKKREEELREQGCREFA